MPTETSDELVRRRRARAGDAGHPGARAGAPRARARELAGETHRVRWSRRRRVRVHLGRGVWRRVDLCGQTVMTRTCDEQTPRRPRARSPSPDATPRASMALVTLSVYDIKHPGNEGVTSAVASLNALTRDGLRLGGIFHGGVEVYGDEWSFGYIDRGTGVYRCQPKKNPMYAYRESVALGVTSLSPARVSAAVAALKAAWDGPSYDALGRNCNHFCEALCEALGCEGPPKWLNSFANNARGVRDAAVSAREATERAVEGAWAWIASATSQSTSSVSTVRTAGEGAEEGAREREFDSEATSATDDAPHGDAGRETR